MLDEADELDIELGEATTGKSRTVTSELVISVEDEPEDRYSRLRLIPWWDQEKLLSARVMVVGAGAIGNEILKNLALLGIGHIFIVDLDTIENSNLTRSVLYREEDEGQPKALVAARRVREINPGIKVTAFHGNIAYDLGLGVFRAMDVVMGGWTTARPDLPSTKHAGRSRGLILMERSRYSTALRGYSSRRTVRATSAR